MTAIEIEGLTVRYRGAWRTPVREAVHGLSLQVNEGEVVGFIGPNGAGKSSTINTLMGFRAPTAGTARIFGRDSRDPECRRGVGYLPEVALYYPWLTAMETLRMYGELHGWEGAALERRAGELLERVGLSGRARERLQRFSKGMLQRLGIAQAVLAHPQLLVLDEVTSGLDPVGRRDVRELLLAQRAEGITVFFSSHELTEVAILCDRILLVHQGQILAAEELDRLMRQLERHTLTALPPTGSADEAAPTSVPGRVLRGRFRADFATAAERDGAAAALQAAGYAEIERGRRDGDLEEYFVSQVGRILS